MSKKSIKKNIIIERDTEEIVILDCPLCNLALQDWEDFFSAKIYDMCSDCKTNRSKKDRKDN
jgi:hypothetical protein